MTNCEFTSIAHTQSALLEYTVKISKIHTIDCYHLTDSERFSKLCDIGCSNFNKKWSCPPNSPSFHEFTSKWSDLFVFHFQIYTDQFLYIKNDYLKIKAANSILKSRADKYLSIMSYQYGSYISTGSCRLCKPCKCKLTMPCAYPDKMTYSFEALGIDVNKLVYMCFQEPLLWYKPKCLPKYTSVVCGLMTNNSISVETLKDKYLNMFEIDGGVCTPLIQMHPSLLK